MAILLLDTESIARLMSSRAKPHAQACECVIANDALQITLRGVDIQKPLVPLMDVVFEVRATLEQPDTVGVSLNITRVGQLPVFMIRPLIKPMLESTLAAAGMVEVVSADRLIVHLNKIPFAGRTLPAFARVDRVQVPGPAGMAAQVEFLLNG